MWMVLGEMEASWVEKEQSSLGLVFQNGPASERCGLCKGASLP